MSMETRTADSLRRKTNARFDTLYTEVIHASFIKGAIECVVRDAQGFLWLCREETLICREVNSLSGSSVTGLDGRVLMPIYGPCPDPIEPLPAGYSAERTALMAEAAAVCGRGRKRRAA